MKSEKGFTLIEVVVYIALFAILMGGAIVTAYSVFESAAHNQTIAIVEEEGNFLTGKIDWALSNAQSIVQPAAGSASSILQITEYSGSNITLSLTGGAMQIQDSTGSFPLSTSNVLVTNLVFTHTAASGDGITPESVAAQFTLTAKSDNGTIISQNFSLTKYLRK